MIRPLAPPTRVRERGRATVPATRPPSAVRPVSVGARVRKRVRADGKVAWTFHCPGCDRAHECDERWSFNGNEERPTFGPAGGRGNCSVLVTYPGDDADTEDAPPKCCHSHVTDGRIKYELDTTHALKGQTVDLPVWATRYTSRLTFPIPIRAVQRIPKPVREPCTSTPRCDPPYHDFTVFSYALSDGAPTKFLPGDAYTAPCAGDCAWSNCSGQHVHVGIPVDGWTHDWDLDSRASNCDQKADREHRCWVRTGSAEAGTLDVGKTGRTCGAGAGSILVGGDPAFHGFVRKGKLVLA